MTTEEAVAALDAIDASRDCEAMHRLADDVLLRVIPPEVAWAYVRVMDRAVWWAFA